MTEPVIEPNFWAIVPEKRPLTIISKKSFFIKYIRDVKTNNPVKSLNLTASLKKYFMKVSTILVFLFCMANDIYFVATREKKEDSYYKQRQFHKKYIFTF